MEYTSHLAILFLLYSVLGIGFVVPLTRAGEMNLSLVASYGVGAYSNVIALTLFQCTWTQSIIIALISGAAFGIVPALLSRVLRGDEFCLCTLACHFIVLTFLNTAETITGGSRGVTLRSFSPPLPLLDEHYSFLRWAAPFLIIGISFVIYLGSGKRGRLLRAESENPLALASIGGSSSFSKMSLFVAISMVVALNGAFYAQWLAFVAPSAFSLQEVTIVLLIAVLGQHSPVVGTLAAALGVLLVPEILRLLPINPSALGPLRQLIFGAGLYLYVMVFKRQLFFEGRSV